MKSVITILTAITLLVGTTFAQPDTLWTKTFGGSDSDCGRSVLETAENEFIITGDSSDYLYLIKMDSEGNYLWSNTFVNGEGNCVKQTQDLGYIITGCIGLYWDEICLIKTDSYGNEQWNRNYGAGIGNSVKPTNDGGYIIAGETNRNGTWDVILIKTDSLGNEEWNNTFGGDSWDDGNDILQTISGNYIIAGLTNSFGAGGDDVWIIETNSVGNSLWSKTYGGDGHDVCNCINYTTDGGYIIGATTKSLGAENGYFWLIKINSMGDSLWSNTYLGSPANGCYSVQQTVEGGYVMFGHTWPIDNRDFVIIKTDLLGNEEWNQTFGGEGFDEYCRGCQLSDNGYILVGSTTSYGAGSADVWLIRLGSETSVENFSSRHPYEFTLLPAYPNPFNPVTNLQFIIPKAGKVTLTIYNIQGREIVSLIDGFQPAGIYQRTFDASELSSGVYFACLKAEGFSQTRKLLLMK